MEDHEKAPVNYDWGIQTGRAGDGEDSQTYRPRWLCEYCRQYSKNGDYDGLVHTTIVAPKKDRRNFLVHTQDCRWLKLHRELTGEQEPLFERPISSEETLEEAIEETPIAIEVKPETKQVSLFDF